MASDNLAGKRRRAENAASTLSKPFKSPLRRPVPNNATTPSKKEEDEENRGSSETPLRGTTEEKNEKHTPTLATPTTSPLPPTSTSKIRKRKNNNTDTSITPTPTKKTSLHPTDPVVADLQKQQRALQSCLAALRSDLDTAQQALRIESSNRDTELEALIAKWRSVSQDAAEEVFAGAQERITRMGGMTAWREQTKNSNARWKEEEPESWFGNPELEGGDVDEKELVSRKEEMMDQLEEVKTENGGVGNKEDEKGEENEEFTMDMMLKTLNVDPQMIGYDKTGQRWVKD